MRTLDRTWLLYLYSETNIVVWMIESSRLDGASLEVIESVRTSDVYHYYTTSLVVVEVSLWFGVFMKTC